MDEPFDGAIPMTQTQSRLTSNESSLRPVLSVPAGAADGGKESNPLSVVIPVVLLGVWAGVGVVMFRRRSEEHTSELQSLMRISYAVCCLKNKHYHVNKQQNTTPHATHST